MVILINIPLCNLHHVELVNHVYSSSHGVVNDSPNQYDFKLRNLLFKWKVVFSLNGMDIGYTDIVTHKINLNDENPMKLPQSTYSTKYLFCG